MNSTQLCRHPNTAFVYATALHEKNSDAFDNQEVYGTAYEAPFNIIPITWINLSCLALTLRAKLHMAWYKRTAFMRFNQAQLAAKKAQREQDIASFLNPDKESDLVAKPPISEQTENQLKQAQALVSRSWGMDLLHLLLTMTAFFYAAGCGMTIAGGMISLLGASTLVVSTALFFGAVGFWINWRNSRFRIPELIESLFFQNITTNCRWYESFLPGLHFYNNEDGETLAFSRKQVAGHYFGLLCSIGVGLSIGALTWEYTASLAATLGMGGLSALLPFIISIITVTVICETALQLRSFIDLLQEEKIPHRLKKTLEKIKEKPRWKQVLYAIVAILVSAVCTAGLAALTHAAFEALHWAGVTHLGMSHSIGFTIACWTTAILQFVGTMPYNFEMVINCLWLTMKSSNNDEQKSLLSQLKQLPATFFHYLNQHWQSFFVGFSAGFCGYIFLATLPTAATPALAMLALTGIGIGIGLAAGLLATLLQERLIPRIINASGNGIVSQKDGLWGIVSACVMSFISSYADVDEQDFAANNQNQLGGEDSAAHTKAIEADSSAEKNLMPGILDPHTEPFNGSIQGVHL